MQRHWSVCHSFGIIHYYTLFSYIFPWNRCTHFIESRHQGFLWDKKTVQIEIFRLLFLRQKRRNATNKIGVSLINLNLLPLAQLYITWMWVHPFHYKQPPKPLKLKNSVNLDFQATFLKQKRRSATKKIGVSLIHLELLLLAQLYIIWN